MNTIPVTVEADHNKRVLDGFFSVDHLWTTDNGFGILPGRPSDILVGTLEVDEGRYDAEGDNYIVELLNVVPGDIHVSYPA